MLPILDRKRQASPDRNPNSDANEADDATIWTPDNLAKRFNNADFGFSQKPGLNPAFAGNPFQKYPFINVLSRKRTLDADGLKDSPDDLLSQPLLKIPLMSTTVPRDKDIKFHDTFNKMLAISPKLYADAVKAAVDLEFNKYSRLSLSSKKLDICLVDDFDNQYITLEQSKTICKETVERMEGIIRNQYEAELSKRLSVQYEAFTKFTNDSLQKHFASSEEPSYIS
ncbi:hypothetical protein ACOME3_007928 [Neoechinorhynchus agilis]